MTKILLHITFITDYTNIENLSFCFRFESIVVILGEFLMFSKAAKCLQSCLILAYDFLGNFNHVKLVSLFPLAEFLKYVLIRFIAENDRFFVALVAGGTKSSFANLVTSGNNIFWLLFFPKFTNDSNNFVTDILLVSKNAGNWRNWTVELSQWKFLSYSPLSILRESS